MQLVVPMFAMVVLTTIIGVMTAYVRIKSAQTGEVDPRYYKLMSGYEIPNSIAKFGRSFNNQFEVPVLFYAAGATALALDLNSSILLTLAWIFVVLRVVHAAIHLTYNHPLHRFVPFALSLFCTLGMWCVILFSVV